MARAAGRAGRETWRRLLGEPRGTITMQWALGAAVLAGVAVASFPEVQGGVARTASGIEDVIAGQSKSDSRSARQAALDAAQKDAAEQAERQQDSQPGGGVLGSVAGSDADAERSGSASGSGGGAGGAKTLEDLRALEQPGDARSEQQRALAKAESAAKQAAEREREAQEGFWDAFGALTGSDRGGSDGSSAPGSGADTGRLRAKSYDDVNALQRSTPEESSKDATGSFANAVGAGARLNDALQDAADARDELRGEGSRNGGSGSKSEPGEVEVRFYRGSSRYVDDD